MRYNYRERIQYVVYEVETGNTVIIYDDETTAASHAGVLNQTERIKEASEQEKAQDATAAGQPEGVPADGAAQAGSG